MIDKLPDKMGNLSNTVPMKVHLSSRRRSCPMEVICIAWCHVIVVETRSEGQFIKKQSHMIISELEQKGLPRRYMELL